MKLHEVAIEAQRRIDAGTPDTNVAHLVSYPADYETDEYCQYMSTDLESIPQGGTEHYRTLWSWATGPKQQR